MKIKTLYRIVSDYCDPTVPGEIIAGTVSQIQDLHSKGKILYNEEAIYDFMHDIVKDKNGLTISCNGVKTTYNPNADGFDRYYQDSNFISLTDDYDNQE